MQTMRERIARRLEPNSWKAHNSDSLAHRNRRTSSLRKADAVLEELREPTEGMVAAAHASDRLYTDSNFGVHIATMQQGGEDHWSAMIDHAREER